MMPHKIDELVRSRRRTIGLLVDKDGRVVVRAPLNAPLALINQFVNSKQDWIEKRKQLAKTRASKVQVRFEEGETFLVQGRSIPLKITQAAKASLGYDGKAFILRKEDQQHAAVLFEQVYKKLARKVLGARLQDLSTELGYPFKQFRLSSANTRWGSCSSHGTISLTWRLVMAPDDVIDYVIIHELSHLKVMNHSTKFWQTVESHMPNYKVNRQWLKNNGHRLSISQE